MQTKFSDGSVMVAGRVTKDADMRHTTTGKRVTSFSMAVGKAKDTTTIYVDVAAWNNLADYAQSITKGDIVCAIGTITEREYKGKTYKTLTCDWLNIAKADCGSAVSRPTQTTSSKQSAVDVQYEELEDDDGDLPF